MRRKRVKKEERTIEQERGVCEGTSSPFYSESCPPGCCQVTVGQPRRNGNSDGSCFRKHMVQTLKLFDQEAPGISPERSTLAVLPDCVISTDGDLGLLCFICAKKAGGNWRWVQRKEKVDTVHSGGLLSLGCNRVSH